jgi:hypothetical protein
MATSDTVPTQQDFDDWFKIVNQNVPASFAEPLKGMPFDEAAAAFPTLYARGFDYLWEQFKEAMQLPVFQWLKSQDGYVRARKRLGKPKKGTTNFPSEEDEALGRALVERVRSGESREDPVRRLQEHIQAINFRNLWDLRVVAALYRYIYKRDAERQLRLRKELLPLLTKLEKLSSQVLPLLAESEGRKR